MRTARLTRGAIACAVGWNLLVSCSDDDELTTIDGPLTPALNRIIEKEQAELEVPGVVVAVIEDGVTTYRQGFGSIKPDGTGSIAASTVFPIGALTKPLTAVGLLRLVDEGRIGLDDPVSKYIPEVGSMLSWRWRSRVTIRQLLTESSGLPDERVSVSFYDPSDSELEAYLTGEIFTQKYHLMFPPGRMFYPSNLGFDLLGLVIERVTGRYYADYMRAEVFKPLRMYRATLRSSEVAAAGDYAFGTNDGVRAIYPLRNVQPWQRPSAMIYASVDDLAKFASFLLNGNERVLSVASLREMRSHHLNTMLHEDRIHQGFGIMSYRGLPTHAGLLDLDLETVGYVGGLFGHTVRLVLVPKERFALIIAANRSEARFDDTAAAALRLYLGAVATPDAEPPFALPDDLSAYEGAYMANTGKPVGSRIIEITVDHDVLCLTCTAGGWTIELATSCADNFQCSRDFAPPLSALTFIRDTSGRVEYLRAMHLGFVARRVLRE